MTEDKPVPETESSESGGADRVMNSVILAVIAVSCLGFGFPLMSLGFDQILLMGAGEGSVVMLMLTIIVGVAFWAMGGAMAWSLYKMWFRKND
jgi:TM2 domain-containing membrane protein YozV